MKSWVEMILLIAVVVVAVLGPIIVTYHTADHATNNQVSHLLSNETNVAQR